MTEDQDNRTGLLIGSAPNAVLAQNVAKDAVSDIVAINNAWRIRPDWTYSIFPDDFDEALHPVPNSTQKLIRSEVYVPANNQFGGIVYAGATMAFTAAYWALAHLKPETIVFAGCDMVYDTEKTHFYGTGKPDPLRHDPTLQNLKAKAIRFEAIANRQGCSCLNLTDRTESNLTYEKVDAGILNERNGTIFNHNSSAAFTSSQVDSILAAEKALGAYYPDGMYWNAANPPKFEDLKQIDDMWYALRR